MSTTNARITHQEGKVVAFQFPGDVLSTTAEGLRAALEAVLQDASAQAGAFQYFEGDLRGARMVDSVGLNLMVWLWRTVTARGARLRLRISSPDIDRTFRFTRFSERAEIELETS
jgi:anti-anti-sigma regulatory factor